MIKRKSNPNNDFLFVQTVQSFPSLTEANDFLAGKKPASSIGSKSIGSKFYGVQRGRLPGVYTNWSEAQSQVSGFRGPKYRRFATWAEANAFVQQGETSSDTPSTAKELPGAPGLGAERPKDELGNEYPPGTGPLPPGAEDGFDPNIMLEPSTGRVVYKTPAQQSATKLQPKKTCPPGMLRIYTDGSALGNGKIKAKAGVGVYFGPEDERYVDALPGYIKFYVYFSTFFL